MQSTKDDIKSDLIEAFSEFIENKDELAFLIKYTKLSKQLTKREVAEIMELMGCQKIQ